MTLVRLGWDSLNLDNIVDVFRHKSQGIPFSSLVFAGIQKSLSGASSNMAFESISSDPGLASLTGISATDERSYSRFVNLPGVSCIALLRSVCSLVSTSISPSIQTKGYLWGFDVINLICSCGHLRYPLNFHYRTYLEDGNDFTVPQLRAEMLELAFQEGYQGLVLFASAYPCKPVISVLRGHDRPFIGKCKSNRMVEKDGQILHVSEIAQSTPENAYRQHKKYRDLKYSSHRVYLPEYGPVRLVIAKGLKEDEDDTSEIPLKYLICSDPNWHGSQIIREFKLHWAVDSNAIKGW